MKTFGVGYIGVEPNRSWAARAHIPALKSVEGFRIAGIANSTPESGRKAADALGIEKSFASADELITSTDVDVVVVTVKVPSHFELVSKVLKAGKHVYCEWPLGRNLEEALELERLASESGVHAVIGTQGLRAPAVLYAKQLIADGYLGEILSISLIGNGGLGGSEVNQANAYTLDGRNNASVLSIPFGHTLAVLRDIFGDLTSIRSLLETRHTTVKVTETGEELPATAPDQVLVSGLFAESVPFSGHYRGGANAGTGLLLEINGSTGNLQITGPIGHIQLAPLTLNGAQGASTPLAPLTIPEQFFRHADIQGPAANVAAIYADLYADLTQDTHAAPSFEAAVALHRILENIERSKG